MEFRVLGPLEVLDGDGTVSIGAAKQRAVLGVLLLHPRAVVSTEWLVDELWGERPPPTAAKLVQGYVHALRGRLGRDVLVTQPPGYALRLGSSTLDLLEFERLVAEARGAEPERAAELRRRALALWRGPPLADVALEGPSAYEIGGLEELRLATQLDLFDDELALGRQGALVGEIESLVPLHPYQERLHAQLMRALYRSGRQADALQVYASLRRSLRDELGLEPGQELRDLEAAILRQEPGLVGGSEAPAPPPAPIERSRDELRPVTVLFADVVGSTRLGELLAPEDVKALVGECVTQMSRAVEEYGGTVQAYEGDGICAYFGVPQAHEDDPERAARTGLRILEVVGEYARDIADAWDIPDFTVRIGINTGRAAVGDVGTASPQPVALGDTTNVAACLERSAPPGAIVVGAETARRLAHRFAFEPIGEIAVEGRAEPVAAALLMGARAVSRARTLRRLVGREPEVGRLRGVVSELEAGRGQALVVVGEPGIGKTRLLAELRSMLGGDATWLEGHCLSYGGLPSWPFVEILRRWLDLELGDPDIVVRTRARARLTPLVPAAPLASLGRLLRIRLDDTGGGGDGGDGGEDAYVAWIEALAEQAPVVVALEDAHWAHPSTRSLAEAVLALTDRAPVLLALTLRRDPGSEGWRLRSRVLDEFSHRATELVLEPLPPETSRALLGALLPGAVDESDAEEIVARAEGNPLYVEELLRALVEGGAVERRHRTWTTTVRPSQVLPPALENLLVARIDRLPPRARRLAQAAAAIGREFPVAALERVAGEPAREDLPVLLRAEIVREVRRYPEPVCAFRQGLLHEAALSTLTPAARRELYAQVADAFEELYGDTLDDYLERLAHYRAQSGDTARAREYLDRAAARA